MSLFKVHGVTHLGAIHAKNVELEQFATLQHRPFPVPYERFRGLS